MKKNYLITFLTIFLLNSHGFSNEPFVVLEYRGGFKGEDNKKIDKDNKFIRDQNYSAIHKVNSGESLSGILNKYYGNTGLMELPNARLSDPATLRFNYSSSFPFEFTSVTATPYEWLEATYRYTEIENVLYGPSGYSGNQSLKDKGLIFVGIDIIGDFITEINVTSPTGIREIRSYDSIAIEEIFWDFIKKKLTI